jgi:serine/threonine-protein kinase OSR1/STK39
LQLSFNEKILFLICNLCRGCFDVGDDDVNNTSPTDLDHSYGRIDNENSGPSNLSPQNALTQPKKFLSGSLQPDNAAKKAADGDR